MVHRPVVSSVGRDDAQSANSSAPASPQPGSGEFQSLFQGTGETLEIRLAALVALGSGDSPGVALERASQQGVEPDERAVPVSLRDLAALFGERALTQVQPGFAVRLLVELKPQHDPGARGSLDLLVSGEQLVLHDLGEGHVDPAAHGRVRVVHEHEALETTGPRVYLHALEGDREALGPEPLAQLVGVDEGPVDQFWRDAEDSREGDFFPGGLSHCPIVTVTFVVTGDEGG
jgi:hypothetical protein